MAFSFVLSREEECRGRGRVVTTGVILWGTVGGCGYVEAMLMLFAAVIIK